MTAAEDMAERHGRLLARYAELSLSLAEDVHAAALAAEDPDQKARLANGFHKLGRALRQSIALEARFVRDRAADRRAAEACAAETARAAVRRRQDQVRAVVERQIYCELEPDEAPAWLADLNERLEEEALYDDFGDESLDDQIARLSAALGLTGEGVRDYTPRALRPRFVATGRGADFARAFREMLDQDGDEDDDDEEDEDDDEAPEVVPPQPAARPVAARPEPRPEPPPEPPPEPAPEAPPEPPPPDPPPPDPPPPDASPPDASPPEPYVPPWERLSNGSYPGGSGY